MSSLMHQPIHVNFTYLRDTKQLYTTKGLTYATPQSVGLDLRACFQPEEITIHPGERHAIPSGIAIEPITQHISGFIYSRSGLGAVDGLTVAQGVGVIDPDYRGELTIILLNTSKECRHIKRGDRIAQLVFQPAFQVILEEVAVLENTSRGTSGFGHTGKN